MVSGPRSFWITGAAAGVVAIMLISCTPDERGSAAPRDPVAVDDIRFEEVTARAGISTERTRSWGATWVDFDDSGFPDLFVNRHGHPPWLLANRGGTYELLNDDFYPSYMDRHGCAWGEANGDRFPDLYCTQGAPSPGIPRSEGKGSGPNQLLLQSDDGFEDVAEDWGVDDPRARGRSVNWIDYNGDGTLDLFVGNHAREGRGDALFENTGDGFRRVDVETSEELQTHNSTSADWDLDGDPDLLILQRPPQPAVAYENQDGSFERIEIEGVTGRAWLSGAWGDFDGDGRPDLHLVSENSSNILRNTSDGFETVHSTRLDFGRMSVWLDVDNDGYLDAYVVQGAHKQNTEGPGRNRPNFLLVQRDGGFERVDNPSFAGPDVGYGDAVAAADHNRNGKIDLFVSNGYGRAPATGRSVLLENRTEGGGWAGLRLRGDDWNPLGIGAEVRVEADGLTYRRQQTDGFNFRNQSEIGYFHLGLAGADEARIEVSWPDGSDDCLHIVQGTIETLAKGSRPCA